MSYDDTDLQLAQTCVGSVFISGRILRCEEHIEILSKT